jgi:hypothetical protein
MKPVEIVLRRGRENDGGGEYLTTIHYKHICKCHNESHLYGTLNKNVKKSIHYILKRI